MKLEIITVYPLNGSEQEILCMIDPINLTEIYRAFRIPKDSKAMHWSHRTIRCIIDSKSESVLMCLGDKGIHQWIADAVGVDFEDCIYTNLLFDDNGWQTDGWGYRGNVGASKKTGTFDNAELDRLEGLVINVETIFGIKADDLR